jgi:hypothetical protein
VWQRLSPGELSETAIKQLQLFVNGNAWPTELWQVTGATWTAAGGMAITALLNNPPADGPWKITLKDATERVVLSAIATSPQGLSLNVASTAYALLYNALGADASSFDIPQTAIDSVAQRITNLLSRTSSEPMLADPGLRDLVSRLAAAIRSNQPMGEYDVKTIESAVGLGNGGGNSRATNPPVSTAPLNGLVAIEQLGAQIAAVVAAQMQGISQTFVAPGTGFLTGFAIDLAGGVTPTPVSLSLFAADAAGRPAGPALAQTMGIAQPGGGLVNVAIPPVPVNGGDQYTLVATPQDGGTITAPTTTGNPYAGGQAMQMNDTWSPVSDADLRFQVFLQP